MLVERYWKWWKKENPDELDTLMQDINSIPVNNHPEIMIKAGMFFRVLNKKQSLLSKNK